MEGLGVQLSYTGFCRLARRVIPVKGYRLAEETRRDLKRAELHLQDEEFAAGLLLSLLLPLAVLLLFCLFFSFLWEPASVLILLLSGLLLLCLPSFLFFQLYPSMLSGEKMSRARGNAILTLLVLCFNLFHQPDLRKAMTQASKVGGRLSSDLKRALLSLERGEFREAREALLHLSKQWAELDETVSESLLDVLRSQTSPDEASRRASLERTVSRLIGEVESEAEEGLGKMVSPTVYFLSFGSLAVVLVIGLSPLFGMLGLGGISLPFYLLSVGCLAMVFWIFTSLALRKRPLLLAAPPTALGPASKALLLSTLSFLLFLPLASRSPLWLVLAAGISLAVFCFLRIGSALKSRKKEERLRQEWRKLISFLGEKMGEGRTFTEALREASTLFREVGPELRESLALMQAKSLDPYSAFFEEGKAPKDPLISGLLETSLELRRRSEAAAGGALQGASEMVERLGRAERRFRERMREAVSNLWMISVVLLPLVCSVSVWVVGTFTRLTSTLPTEWSLLSPGLTPAELTLFPLLVGLLSLVLSLTVARYIAGMTAPGDRAVVLYCIGRTAFLSTLVYLSSLLLFSRLA
jgi:hypothetical protein